MTSVAEQVERVRRGAVALCLTDASPDGWGDRGLVEVTGSDARRWLDGMVSNDVTAIAPDGARSGCYATVLTPKGRILADLNVLARDDGYWLETAHARVPSLVAALDRYVIADDVRLSDRSADFDRIGLEGAAASALLDAASGASTGGVPRDSWIALEIASLQVVAARFGWSGEDAFQLFAPSGGEQAVVDALRDAAGRAPEIELVPCSMAALDVLRIEAGVPLYGAELDDEVFPDEARLDRAISRTKGCYTGQEIVARLYSRGAVNHLLVGIRFDAEAAPPPGTELASEGRKTGEVTSACASPSAGAIGLGYVRRDHAEPGTPLDAAGVRGEVASLPIVAPATRRDGRS